MDSIKFEKGLLHERLQQQYCQYMIRIRIHNISIWKIAIYTRGFMLSHSQGKNEPVVMCLPISPTLAFALSTISIFETIGICKLSLLLLSSLCPWLVHALPLRHCQFSCSWPGTEIDPLHELVTTQK